MPKTKKNLKPVKTSSKQPKPPVVTIMGHVDHGKTTLLDYIRKSNLTSKEIGGITQSIGAYQITHQGKPITFIDTPGHAAFSQMRARGAAVTDIIILVVAADDGVKPQTKESIKYIQAAGVPVIVAINKIDLKTAVPEMAKAQLVEAGINVEGYGGNTPVVEISATKGTQVDKLLDTVLVLAELEEIGIDPASPLQIVVIESNLHKNLGPVASVLVKAGTLKLGQMLASVLLDPPITGKVKRLLLDTGKPTDLAGPATPVRLLGLKSVPPAGTVFTTTDQVAEVTGQISDYVRELQAPTSQVAQSEVPTPEPEVETKTDAESTETASPAPVEESEAKPSIKIILKADTRGSLEAVKGNLSNEINIISSGTGEVNESDILMAQTTDAVVIAFHTPISTSARKLAKVEKVPVHRYDIIYKLLEEFESQVLKLLEPTIDEEELGRAKIQAIFEIKDNLIAGCKVNSGKLPLRAAVHLKRGDKIITDSKISSLKQGKVDVTEIKAGEECGVILNPRLKVAEGDVLIAFKKIDES